MGLGTGAVSVGATVATVGLGTGAVSVGATVGLGTGAVSVGAVVATVGLGIVEGSTVGFTLTARLGASVLTDTTSAVAVKVEGRAVGALGSGMTARSGVPAGATALGAEPPRLRPIVTPTAAKSSKITSSAPRFSKGKGARVASTASLGGSVRAGVAVPLGWGATVKAIGSV